ncbi:MULTISPECIES: DUF6544 family protein [unclassified Microcoleus]|uniref:DUF6920 family protein n=1 Tax=unclassified Microcoleus TaxID=2642155 RepID=UPI001D9C3C4A|nr:MULTISPECIES: DUF6544 family protein [unclassified Microcoleus]TAE05473.1 MAG: hypothetical protein EAZ94_32285 [Oscillatoriales cyanobacterium]MCC3416061.1 hypothetical protein [Microcoleus sp. PH2017_02_FOX_O_A]MCC3475801.1 hypothetical protein [Microcoleus sp. PH2017_13_LAR_U_A]MCC3488322.1 hypothetical protein [Microcoleus sp. PH2017_14_LAR_D_A]MCC3500382.1 hypothetical protein [Microcoleus sp. PH2017_15_JOR_U_A]
MWIKWMAIVGVLIVVSLGIAAIYGSYRWQSNTDRLRAKLINGQRTIKSQIYDQKEIEGLPEPVQRFFQTVIKDGQAIASAVKLSQQGLFNLSETEDKWSPFTATQFVTTQRPGFDWDARIQMAPGVNAFVHDTYLLGEGSLHASLLGLFTVANMHGAPENNQGELLRFLAETPWYPTALLPSQGVRWEAINDTSARATLTDGATTVSVVFQFNAEGAIATMRAEARYRDKLTAMPWCGRFGEYSVRNGMLIPLEGEVGWEYPEGIRLYFKGRITEIEYEFAS